MHPLRVDTLHQLRQSMAQVDRASHGLAAPRPPLPLGVAAIDAVLGGGLAFGALHELAPALPVDTGASTGFALALAARSKGPVLWLQSDYGQRENGTLYGPGLDLFGLSLDRLTILTAAHGDDVLWAMEEALRSRVVRIVIGELPAERASGDGMAARRLSFTARDAGGLGLLLRPHPALAPSAAATRWQIAAAPGAPDELGGLGTTTFALSLTKNRRGPCGRWLIAWNHHDRVFHEALSLGVAAASSDRSDRAPLVHTG
jgi:protein ImuA